MCEWISHPLQSKFHVSPVVVFEENRQACGTFLTGLWWRIWAVRDACEFQTCANGGSRADLWETAGQFFCISSVEAAPLIWTRRIACRLRFPPDPLLINPERDGFIINACVIIRCNFNYGANALVKASISCCLRNLILNSARFGIFSSSTTANMTYNEIWFRVFTDSFPTFLETLENYYEDRCLTAAFRALVQGSVQFSHTWCLNV